jgi:hypothetical protein
MPPLYRTRPSATNGDKRAAEVFKQLLQLTWLVRFCVLPSL